MHRCYAERKSERVSIFIYPITKLLIYKFPLLLFPVFQRLLP
jgi:hypothetical protein